MDNKSREARKLAMISTNGFSRRRHRSATSDGGSHVELPETVRLRDWMVKKDRDRDRDSLLSRSKRRRSSHSMHREEGEDSTEESVGNEQDYDDSGVSRRLSPHAASSVSDHNHRKTVPSARHGRRQPPPPPAPRKVSDEMISFPVPRKARSVSGKRSHENWISAGGNGGGDDPQPSNSPARMSFETVSPSSSNVSVRKKAKTIGSKIQLPQSAKSPSTTQEDIEIEIAGLLCDLMASKKSDSPLNSESNEKHNNGSNKDVAEIACSIANSPNNNLGSTCVLQITSACSDPSSDNAMKNNHSEVRVGIPSTLALHNSTGHDGRVLHAKQGAPSREPANLSEKQVSKLDTNYVNSDSDGGADRNLVSEKEKSSSNDADKQELPPIGMISNRRLSNLPQNKCKREEKFEIDLMAPPPVTLSPEQDGPLLGYLTSEAKSLKNEDLINVVDNVETPVKNEVIGDVGDESNTIKGKREFRKLDLDKLNQEGSTSDDMKGASWQKEQHKVSSGDALKKAAQSTLAPSPVAAAGWQNGLPPLGYMQPPFQTFASADRIIGSSISPALQHPVFSFSQPRSKRCATHQFIARNIALHNNFVKTNQYWPAAVSSTSITGAEFNMLQSLPPAENTGSGRQLQRTSMGGNLDFGRVKGGATQIPGVAAIKALDSSNSVDSTQRKQFTTQQSSQPSSTCGLMRGTALIYPPSQHQATVANQHGPDNSSNSGSKSENSAAGSLAASSAMPAMSTVNFGYPQLGNNQAPYLAIIHKNGYPFSFQAPVGTGPAFNGENCAQTMPVINGPFYSSQMLHPSQIPQQQTLMQTLIQPPNHAISTFSKASSSHKQQHGAPVAGNKMLTPTTLQSQQPQLHGSLSHLSRQAEDEISGESTHSLVGRSPYSQNGFHGQSFSVQSQPLNFSLKTSTPSGSNSTGNYSEKHQSQQQQRQHTQQKTHIGGVELMPSLPDAISFASFNVAGGVPSSLNFSSTAQNPVIFQSLSDVTHLGYHVAGVSPSAQKNNHSASDGKIAGRSTQADDEKKAVPGKLSNSGPTTLVFDNPSRTMSFMPSPVIGGWPSHSIAPTKNAPLASNASCSQQPHVLQHQKQHIIQHQQHAMPARSKTSTASKPSTGTWFPNNPLVFSQTLMHCNSSVSSSQGMSSGRASDSQTHHPSLMASTMTSPTQPSFVQQGRVLRGRTQISFGGNSHLEGVLPSQTQVVTSNQPCKSNADCSPSGCNSRSNQESSKSGPLQMQQTDNSSAGTGQKSSPVCGRNLPSLLSTCPSHLSELKY